MGHPQVLGHRFALAWATSAQPSTTEFDDLSCPICVPIMPAKATLFRCWRPRHPTASRTPIQEYSVSTLSKDPFPRPFDKERKPVVRAPKRLLLSGTLRTVFGKIFLGDEPIFQSLGQCHEIAKVKKTYTSEILIHIVFLPDFGGASATIELPPHVLLFLQQYSHRGVDAGSS